jgi:hypothetical protein
MKPRPSGLEIMACVWGCAGAALLAVGVVSCNEQPEQAPDAKREVFDVPKQQVEGERFTVVSHGRFKAGFENNVREILIITDTQTKRAYLGITGVGVTELRTEKEGKHDVTVER